MSRDTAEYWVKRAHLTHEAGLDEMVLTPEEYQDLCNWATDYLLGHPPWIPQKPNMIYGLPVRVVN